MASLSASASGDRRPVRRVRLRVKRQAGPEAAPTWDVFEFPLREKMNVILALMEVRKEPVTVEGVRVEPPAWEAACLEEVCGSCTMLVNGMVRQSCTALLEQLADPEDEVIEVTLEPMTKFPVVRDLIVDRSRMFGHLKRIKAWVPIDGSFDLGMAPPQDDGVRQLRYALSRCMSCGCCVEACPQVSEKSSFIGPAALGQTLLFNLHPVGQTLAPDRLEVLIGEDGITNCGNAQNCVKVCPKGVPLTRAIALLNRDTTVYKLKKWIGLAG